MSTLHSPHLFGTRELALDWCTPAPMHQSHPQSKADDPIQRFFNQLRSNDVSAIPLLNLYSIESECQTYIAKLTLEKENMRKDCIRKVDVLQGAIDDLYNTIRQFERLSFGSDHSGPMSILGSMICQQSGCFFRCDKLDDLQKHTEKGLHCRFQLQHFVLTHEIAFEATSAPRTGSPKTENFQRIISEHDGSPMTSSPAPDDLDPSEVSLGPQNVVESIKELQNDAGQQRASNHDSRSHTVHPHDTEFDRKDQLSRHTARFKCNLCSKSFTRSYTLAEHIRAHSGERPFGCSACSKRFTRLKDRNRHQFLHSGDKRFLCHGVSDTGEKLGCHRRFAREDGLISHLRSESAFTCLEPLLDIFAMHIISRTSKDDHERQYCCHPPNGCGLRFQHLKDLKTHFHSEAGKTCIKSRLITFALAYFDHKRVPDKPWNTGTILSACPKEAREPMATEISYIPQLSSDNCEVLPMLTQMHSKTSYSHMPAVETPRAFGSAQSSFAPGEFPTDPFPGTEILEWQQTKEPEISQIMKADGYMASDASFGPSGVVEESRNLGLKIECYTPTRGIAGDIMQLKVRSSVPLRCAVFNIQIGWFVEPEPRLQNMNAIVASVEAESIAPASFYRYTISAKIPHPWNQPRLSPVPVVLEINGLRKYGGKMYELLAVGDFTYEEAYETAEMDK